MDDFYIVGKSSQELLSLIPPIRDFLALQLGLNLHPRKIYLAPISKGVSFLGAVVKPFQRYVYPKCHLRLRSNLLCSYVEETNPYKILAKQKSYVGYLSHFNN